MERYKKLKNRPTILKSSTTRQLTQLDVCMNELPPNKTVFEDKRLALRSNLTSLRKIAKTLSELLVDLNFENVTAYEDALKDLEENELALEKKEEAAAKLKQNFDATIHNSKSPSKSVAPPEKKNHPSETKI